MHRFTGAFLSGSIYVGSITYAVAPFASSSLIGSVYSLPLVPILMKAALSFPFVYHSLNGVRHLFWDYGRLLSIKNVYASGYVVSAGTVLGTAYLCSL